MRQIVSDLRYEIRALVRRPGWAVAAVLLLSLGIGANTAIFAAIHTLILRPLPYQDGDRMAYVWQTADQGGTSVMISPRASLLAALQERATTLEWVEPYQAFSATLLEGDDPALANGARVSPSLFAALGVRPAIGRPFVAGDVDGEPVAILSYAMWRTRFGGDSAVVNRVMHLADGNRTIVAVMPADFPFIRPSTDTEFWVPRSAGIVSLDDGPVFALALLRSGVTLEAAQAELQAMAYGLGEVDPELAGWSPTLVSPAEMTGDEIRTAVLVLQGAVALVLLIACGNVANLLLARGLRRRRELTIRAALGAGRFRLARQLLVQGLMLGLASGALGLLVASWGVDVIKGLRPDSLASLDALTLHPTSYWFALLLALATGTGVGLAPALRSTRVDLAETLKQTGSAGGDARHAWMRGGLVGAQIALSLVLLVGAALLARSFVHLINRDPGFDAQGLLAVTIEPPRARYPTMADEIAFFEQLAERLRGDARVDGASVGGGLPPETGITVGAIHVEGQEEPLGAGDDVRALVRADHEYFRVMRIPIVEGRAFDLGDAVASTRLPGTTRTVKVPSPALLVSVSPSMRISAPASGVAVPSARTTPRTVARVSCWAATLGGAAAQTRACSRSAGRGMAFGRGRGFAARDQSTPGPSHGRQPANGLGRPPASGLTRPRGVRDRGRA